MFRLTRSYRWCITRLHELDEVLTPAERFVLTVAFTEKIIRRVLVQMAIDSGLSESDALTVSRKASGLRPLNQRWKKYDSKSRTLSKLLGTVWTTIDEAADLRNELIHGSGHRDHRIYHRSTEALIAVLPTLRATFKAEYGYSGWKHKQP